MLKRICALAFFALLAAAVWLPSTSRGAVEQDDLAAFKNNQCVTCHASDALAGPVANRYLEWHASAHMLAGVSCDKCHGGDPSTRDKGKAHAGVNASSDPKSRLNPANVSGTCASCHSAIATSFDQSVHSQKVKASPNAPSCNTCHQHMASSVARFSEEAMGLCSQCHAGKAELVGQAGTAMDALGRANGVVTWADRLIEAGQDKKLSMAADEAEMKSVHAQLQAAEVEWHAFRLAPTQQKADEAFASGTKVKDRLMKKLGFAK